MMTTKLVLRILDSSNQMLGWAEVLGEARGDGCIWVKEQTFIGIELEGIPAILSVHWCDVNVEIRSPIEFKNKAVKVGEVFSLPGEMQAFRCGEAAGGLPPVTVRNPILVDVPVGVMGAVGSN